MEPGRTLTWDGRSDAGRETASGMYLIRVVGEKTASVQRVLKIR
jgi:hypothetical protein